MREELEQQLFTKYPGLFRDRHGDTQQTRMVDGVGCGDGWYDLLDKLCADITAQPNSEDVAIFQIKEKFGGLRFYVGAASSAVHDLISAAEAQAYKVCEVCGSADDVKACGPRWLKSLCPACRKVRIAEVEAHHQRQQQGTST